jgi:CRP-like cAMP-binding protein
MLTVMEKVALLQTVEVFRAVPTQSLARVAAIAQEVDYQPRQALYNDNEAADSMFVLLEGEVALLRPGQEGKKVGPGQVAGLLAFLAGDFEPESAMATQPVRALRLDQEDFYDAMAEDFNLTRGILRAVVRWATAPRGLAEGPGHEPV